MLEIKKLTVEIEGKKILKNLDLEIQKGKIHALMGPNGSGKSTLANVLMGNPKYKITSGKIYFEKKEITNMPTNERAKLGMFLSFQYPQEVDGVTITNFLRQAYNSTHHKNISIFKFKKIIKNIGKELDTKDNFLNRYLNKGFSGGEKKKSEMIQLLTLDPKFAILDETDSGLDVDALKIISKAIKKFMNKEKTCLVITHYKRILEHLSPDEVSIMVDGKIVKSGTKHLAQEIEEKGYSRFLKN